MELSTPELEVYSVKEVAEILKTSQQQVRKMILAEELPAIKVGREWRIAAVHLQDFICNSIE